MSQKYSLMPEENVIEGLKTDTALIEAVTKKKESKGVSDDPYLDLAQQQFDYTKEMNKEQGIAQQQAAQTQGLMGGMQSGVQTAFGSQTQEQALGGALMTGFQTGMATGNPYVGAAAGIASLFMGSRNAKKAEKARKKAEAEEKKQRKLQNMREAVSGYGKARQSAMTNLMNVLS